MELRQAGFMIACPAAAEEFAFDAVLFLSEIDKATQRCLIGFLGMIRGQLALELDITRS